MEQFLIKFSNEKLNINDALEFVSDPKCGAISIFIGTTRINEKHEHEKKVSSLFYEAYETMALKMMENIIEELLAKADDSKQHKIFVCHKLGQVPLGDASLIIAVSSPHRSSGHQMVMDILNQIKQKVPIWKQVCYECCDHHSGEWSSNSEAFWLKK